MRGHSFTIRRFKESPLTIVNLIADGMLDPGLAALLWLAAENKQGIVIYGPTGSGKTTLLNAIAMLIPPEMKIVTAEDTPEIRLPLHDNWVSTVTRLSSDTYVQNVTLQAQVESAMRQRPDILILGEIRSREAYSFFQAVSTGHGGMTTIHAENIASLIRRLVAPPMNVPKSLVATCRLFVHVQRFVESDKVVRRVVYMYETEDYDPVNDKLLLNLLSIFGRDEGSWYIAIDNSATLKSIATLLAVDYSYVVEDLKRRASLLNYAVAENMDILQLHALVRRYGRNPENTYREILKRGVTYDIKILGKSEKITL